MEQQEQMWQTIYKKGDITLAVFAFICLIIRIITEKPINNYKAKKFEEERANRGFWYDND
jgi:hypothetical protein